MAEDNNVTYSYMKYPMKGDEAKELWMKLRNNHRDALRRHKRSTKNGAPNSKPWKYQSKMEFLLPHMVNMYRDMNSTNDEDHSEPTIRQKVEPHFDDQIDVENGELDQASPSGNIDWDNSLDTVLIEPVETPPHPPIKKPKPEVKKFDYYSSNREISESSEEKKSSDHLYLFFMSMYELTKKMPATSQHLVKRNIFQSVSQEEARLLNILEPEFSPPPQFPT